MFQPDFITILLITVAFGLTIYKISFFRRKSIGYFSLVQFIYLIIIPGTIYIALFSHIQSILNRPLITPVFLPDKLLLNLVLLAQLFTYGGIAIHAVTKMLSGYIDDPKSKLYEINSFFHLKFSHNLIYGGAVTIASILPLLEINHVPPDANYSIWISILLGILSGICLIMAMYWYRPYGEQRFSKWSDLKTVFLLIWLGLLIFILAIRTIRPDIKEYQLFIPMLSGFIVMTIFNLMFVLRRLKNGGFRIYLRLGKQEQTVLEVNQPFPLHNKQSPTK